MRCLIMFMINLSPVQLEADVGELEKLPVQETPLYWLEELQDRIKDIQVHLAKMQDQIGMVSQRLVKFKTIYMLTEYLSPLFLLEYSAQA